MRTLQIIPVITSREMVQLTAEQRVFVVLNYTRTQSTAREGGHVEGHGA